MARTEKLTPWENPTLGDKSLIMSTEWWITKCCERSVGSGECRRPTMGGWELQLFGGKEKLLVGTKGGCRCLKPQVYQERKRRQGAILQHRLRAKKAAQSWTSWVTVQTLGSIPGATPWNGAFDFKLQVFFIFILCMFCLNLYLHTNCLQCPQRP